MINMKIGVITGGTGGIGGEGFATVLSPTSTLFLPVRKIDSPEALALRNLKNTHVSECNVEDKEATLRYFQELSIKAPRLDFVILAAGTFKWDKNFPGATQAEREQQAIEFLTRVNLYTKETVVEALRKAYGEKLKNTILIIVISHAARFGVDHPWRKGEEGYVQAMAKVLLFGEKLKEEGIFKEVILLEPGLVDTPMARAEFTKETIGEDPDWGTVPKPLEYTTSVLNETELE